MYTRCTATEPSLRCKKNFFGEKHFYDKTKWPYTPKDEKITQTISDAQNKSSSLISAKIYIVVKHCSIHESNHKKIASDNIIDTTIKSLKYKVFSAPVTRNMDWV